MLLAYPVMYAINLPFEQAPGAFDAVDVDKVPADILAGAVVDAKMVIVGLEAGIARMLIRHKAGTRLDVLLNLLADRLRLEVVHLGNADFAAALQETEDRHLARAALGAALALAGMLIGFLAADEALVHLNLTL